jgi:hypothetical protein
MGEYRPTYLGKFEIPKWERLELYKTFTARTMMLDQRYDSFSTMIRHILGQFTADQELCNQDWELVQSVSKANGGTIHEYGLDVDALQITSLRVLFSIIQPKRKDPFLMVLLARTRLPPLEEVGYEDDGTDMDSIIVKPMTTGKQGKTVKSELGQKSLSLAKREKMSIKSELSRTNLVKAEKDGTSEVKRGTKSVDPFTMELRNTRKRTLSDLSVQSGRKHKDWIKQLGDGNKLDEEADKADQYEETLFEDESDVSLPDLAGKD